MKINFPPAGLAIGAFGIGTTEFSLWDSYRLSPAVDASLSPAAGMLISAYAIGVIGAPLMTLLLSHRAPQCADFPDGYLYPWQRALRHFAGLHHADAVTYPDKP